MHVGLKGFSAWKHTKQQFSAMTSLAFSRLDDDVELNHGIFNHGIFNVNVCCLQVDLNPNGREGHNQVVELGVSSSITCTQRFIFKYRSRPNAFILCSLIP